MKPFFVILWCFLGLGLSAQQFESKTLYFDGHQRLYDVYVPASYDGTLAYPLIFNFHGGNGDIASQVYTSDMRPLADTAHFIAVYPQALEDPNDGNSTNWIHKDPTTHDDVNFIEVLLDTLSADYNVDAQRIYACGYSLGGEFTFEVLCRLNSRIAAASAVARTMQQYTYDNCNPVHPTGFQTILGTDDGISLYNGVSYMGVSYYVSADDMHAFWANHNNADAVPVETALPDSDPTDGSTVDRRRWENGDQCVTVEELRVNGGGHDWPGTFGNMDINATNEIWNFVSRYDLNGLIDCTTSSIAEDQRLYSNRQLIRVLDVLGKEVKIQPYQPLFYQYDDGTVEKKMMIEK